MKSLPFDNPFTEQFFSGYLVDHYLYKISILFNTIEKYDKIKQDVLDHVEDIEDSEVCKSLRLEIRATYFQAMETLFELIFSIEPRSNIIDKHLWYFLSTSHWRKNFKRIEAIAKGDTSFLDRIIIIGEDIKIPFIQYLFYFILTNPKEYDSIIASFDPIKKFIVKFAEEFSDRAEYNAFKHALRILPTIQKFEVSPRNTGKPILSLDMSNSMTYLIEESGSISFRTKPLDTIRDMRMGIVCSCLIANIIKSRKMFFSNQYESNLNILSTESFPSANESAIKWKDFYLTLKPIMGQPKK